MKYERELLTNFLRWHQSENLGITFENPEIRVDEYLKLINDSVSSDTDHILGEFAEAERALLRLVPSGEGPDAEHLYSILEFFRDKLLGRIK